MIRHTDANDIELEASLQQLLLNLLGDAVETNVASGKDSIALRHCHSHLCDLTQRLIERMTDAKDERRGRVDGQLLQKS